MQQQQPATPENLPEDVKKEEDGSLSIEVKNCDLDNNLKITVPNGSYFNIKGTCTKSWRPSPKLACGGTQEIKLTYGEKSWTGNNYYIATDGLGGLPLAEETTTFFEKICVESSGDVTCNLTN